MADVKWAADERKLQPVYDDIQTHRLKPAESAVTRYLKKHPKSQPALILRLVLLERTRSSTPQILKAFEDIKSTGELSSRGAWWVSVTLRNIQRWDLLLTMYSGLWNAQRDRADLGEQVFLVAAAAWDTTVMVSSSRKMFNLVKSAVWARVAAWAEWVHRAPRPTPQIPFPAPAAEGSLGIAKTLLSTTPRECATSDQLWLRLQILMSAGDLDEAYTYACDEGFGGSLARAWWRMEAVPIIFERMKETGRGLDWKGEWEAVEAVVRGGKEARRNYAFYRYLIRCAQTSELVKKTDTVFSELDEEIGEKERAPLLARLELEKATIAMSDEEWAALVERYWTRWGSKGSMISELEGIASGNEVRLSKLEGMMKYEVTKGHTDENSYRKLVNAENLLLRRQTSGGDAKHYWRIYHDGLQYGRNLPKTDVQPADEIGLVAVQLLIAQWHVTPSDERSLLQAVACARYIVSKSPACAHAHFLLMRLYRLIGALVLISTPLEALKPTEIQLDNLLHAFFERGATDVLLSQTAAVFTMYGDKARSLYWKTAVDLPEYVKQALEHESYSKIHGIRALSSRLADSLSRAALAVEDARLSLVRGSGISEDIITTLAEIVNRDVTDNRNFELMPEIGGARESTRGMTEIGGGLSGAWVKAYARILVALGRFAKGDPVDGVKLPDADSLLLLPAERAVLLAITGLLRRADQAISSVTQNGDAKESEGPSIAAIFNENVKLCLTENHPTRWSCLYSCALLVELSRAIDLIGERINELAKPASKGKKKPAVQVTELAVELKAARRTLQEQIPEVLQLLDGEVERDASLDWSSMQDGFFEDDKGFLLDTGRQIIAARSSAISNLKDLLKERK